MSLLNRHLERRGGLEPTSDPQGPKRDLTTKALAAIGTGFTDDSHVERRMLVSTIGFVTASLDLYSSSALG